MKFLPCVFVLVACGGATPTPAPTPARAPAPTAPADSRCTAPAGYFEPGCGAAAFEPGCYTACTTSCAAGFTCTKVMSLPGPAYDVYDVCAIEHHICMPDSGH